MEGKREHKKAPCKPLTTKSPRPTTTKPANAAQREKRKKNTKEKTPVESDHRTNMGNHFKEASSTQTDTKKASFGDDGKRVSVTSSEPLTPKSPNDGQREKKVKKMKDKNNLNVSIQSKVDQSVVGREEFSWLFTDGQLFLENLSFRAKIPAVELSTMKGLQEENARLIRKALHLRLKQVEYEIEITKLAVEGLKAEFPGL